ncbi:hypothetical protein C8Q77DRAFT_1139634 [Trametes polyzona]|nr:hypothetical protein C8Q77DRAFT_1139634 [Trametes polyzona]
MRHTASAVRTAVDSPAAADTARYRAHVCTAEMGYQCRPHAQNPPRLVYALRSLLRARGICSAPIADRLLHTHTSALVSTRSPPSGAATQKTLVLGELVCPPLQDTRNIWLLTSERRPAHGRPLGACCSPSCSEGTTSALLRGQSHTMSCFSTEVPVPLDGWVLSTVQWNDSYLAGYAEAAEVAAECTALSEEERSKDTQVCVYPVVALCVSLLRTRPREGGHSDDGKGCTPGPSAVLSLIRRWP